MEIKRTSGEKKLHQWFFNISKFSDELLEDLESLNHGQKKLS